VLHVQIKLIEVLTRNPECLHIGFADKKLKVNKLTLGTNERREHVHILIYQRTASEDTYRDHCENPSREGKREHFTLRFLDGIIHEHNRIFTHRQSVPQKWNK